MKKDCTEYPYGCVELKEEDLKKDYLSDFFTIEKKIIANQNNKEFVLKEFYKKVKENKNSEHVWALVAKRENDDNWICLQVGSSANNIFSEIKTNIIRMLSMREKKEWHGYFNKKVVLFCADYGCDVLSQKYESIYKKFDVFKFLLIDHETYISNCNFKSKIRFAETKFAFECKALYWNPINIEYEYLKYLDNKCSIEK